MPEIAARHDTRRVGQGQRSSFELSVKAESTAGVSRNVAEMGHKSGTRRVPELHLVPPPAAHESVAPLARRLCARLDRLIAASSLVPNDPVLNMRDFAWTGQLRDHWREIRDEAAVCARSDTSRQWRNFLLWGYGRRAAGNVERCPVTSRIVAQIPGLSSACFAVLAPGTHLPARHGVTKGLITCHLGLAVPRDGDVRMRIASRVVRWAEGETLVFDDTHEHEVWNESGGTRVVLMIQFRRPLRQPGKWIADSVLDLVRRSPFARRLRADLPGWSTAMHGREG